MQLQWIMDYGVTCEMEIVRKSMWCNKVQFPNTNPQCRTSKSPRSASKNGSLTTKDSSEQVQSGGGMEVGSIYTHEVLIECDTSPTNP